MKDINLELYRVFYETARAGSFSRAAESLFITQPAVSRAVKQLEDSLGGAVFFRTAKGVKLTKEGEVLLRYIEQAFNFVKAAEHKISEMHKLDSGEIRIGASDTLCRHYLLPYLESFHKQYPQVKLHVTNRTSPETVKLLREGKIDFGLVNLPVTDSYVDVLPFMSVEDVFIAGSKYDHLCGQMLTLEQLAGYPLIMLEHGSSTRAYIDAVADKAGIRLQPEIELGSLDLLVQFAKIGLGLACVTKQFVGQELGEGAVFEISLTEPIPSRSIGLVTLQDAPLSVAAGRLLAWIGAVPK